MYQIEQQHVEQELFLNEIRSYVDGAGTSDQMQKVESTIFKIMLQFGLSCMKEVLARRGSGKCGDEVTLDSNVTLPFHSENKRRSYLSIFGWLEIERAYYWRKDEDGFYPLDADLNLPQRSYSYLLDQWVGVNVIGEAYDTAIEKIAGIFGLEIWKRGQEDVMREVATDVPVFYQEKAVPEGEGAMLCATADCKGVRMVPSEKPERRKDDAETVKPRRGKGDKRAGLRRDAVVTADFSFVPEARTAEEVVAALMKTRSQVEVQTEREARRERRQNDEPEPREPKNKQVMANMFGKEAAFRDLLDRLHQRDPEEKKPIFALLDGASALKDQFLAELDRRGWKHRLAGIGLDIIHVQEYIWDAGTALFGEKSPERIKWVKEKTLALLRGDVGRVIGGLRQIVTKGEKTLCATKKKHLNRTITYFSNHRDMMEYDKYLAAGYPIATGVIEGACNSLVKERTDGSGMRWTKAGVQPVLNMRAVYQNGDWDAYWEYHIQCEQKRNYPRMSA
jgi:hypothetical protein